MNQELLDKIRKRKKELEGDIEPEPVNVPKKPI